jgi:hypothetical protein
VFNLQTFINSSYTTGNREAARLGIAAKALQVEFSFLLTDGCGIAAFTPFVMMTLTALCFGQALAVPEQINLVSCGRETFVGQMGFLDITAGEHDGLNMGRRLFERACANGRSVELRTRHPVPASAAGPHRW